MYHVSTSGCSKRSPRRNKLTASLLCLVLLLPSCQQMSLEEETGGSGGTSCATPVGFGEGTAERPFTVADVQKGRAVASQAQVWVIGYAVGSAYRSLDNATFSPSAASSSSLLLSADSACTQVSRCIPVELGSVKWQRQFALSQQPAGFRQCVMLRGVPSKYYNKNGLRSLSAGRWFLGLDLSCVSRDPQEWETDTICASVPPQR